MSGPRGRIFASRTITTRTPIGVTISLIIVGLICTQLTFQHALAAVIVSDNFNDNSIDTSKWNPNDLFSGFTNTNVPIAETSQRLEIGPLLQNVSGSSYRGMRTVNTYDFSDDYAFVELVQAPASNTNADAMFTVGYSVTAYYRMRVSAGTLTGVRNIGGTKTTLFSISYNSTNHRFLRIRHTAAGAVTLDTAPANGSAPGTWTQQYSEVWSSSIQRDATQFEVKGGTFQVEANAPGKVIFDNFEVGSNTAPEVISISPNSGSTSGGTSVTITGTGFSAGATVTLGGTAATNVSVVSSVSITATTPAHAAGAVDVVVTNSDGQDDTLSNGFTYSGSGNQISNINVASNCNTSALINFSTSAASRAFIEYGTTTSYGSSTIDDPVRFYTEHAIPLTGLSANTTYHYRINANSNGVTQSADQSFTTAASGGVCPNLPAQVDSRMPDMTGAVEYVVKANCTGVSNCFTNFQTALNTAGTDSGKRFVTVDAGLSFTGSFTLPANSDGNWIIVRSSAHASLPEGKRVVPADASNMFKVIANTQVDGAIETAAGANHIRIIGMESTIDPSTASDSPGGAIIHSNINFNKNVGGNAANLAKFIGIDRSYIHGLTTKNNRRGVYWEGEDLFIIDSQISEFHDINSDGQAVLAVTTKRGKILNNTLVADGENFMWGGTGQSVAGYVIGGIEFSRNHLYKPCTWKVNGGCGATYGGKDWREKNLFECKSCAQLLVFGNYFGGTTDSQGGYWPDAQSLAVNLKLEQNSVAPTTCDVMEDITFYKNFGKNMHAGWAVVGRTGGTQPSTGCTNKPERVLLRDNVFELDATTWTPEASASSGSWNATEYFLGGTEDLQIVHNTMIAANPTQGTCVPSLFSDGTLILVGDTDGVTKWAGFVFKDNISDYRGCGVAGAGFNGNNAVGSLDAMFTGWVFTKNGIMRTGGDPGHYPTGQIWVTSYTGLFTNFNSGLDGNYRVVNGSAFNNAASDGTNLGADVNGAEAATANSPTGNWPAP